MLALHSSLFKMGKTQKDILNLLLDYDIRGYDGGEHAFPLFLCFLKIELTFSFSERHPELNENYDVCDGGGEHAGDGRPLHREQAHG